MPVTTEQALEYIGIDLEKFEDMDAMKAAFDGSYLKRENAHMDKDVADKVFGKTNNTLRNKLAKFSELGFDDDFRSVNPSEAIDSIRTGMEDRLKTLKVELEDLKKGGGSNKEVDAIKLEVEAKRKEAEAFKANAIEWQGKYDTVIASNEKEKSEGQLNGAWSKALGTITFNEGVNEYAKKGFVSELRSKYKLEFGEDGTEKVLNDGKIVMDPKKAQTFATLADVLKQESEIAKLSGIEPPKEVRKTIPTTVSGLGIPPEQQRQPAPTTGRRVMPA